MPAKGVTAKKPSSLLPMFLMLPNLSNVSGNFLWRLFAPGAKNFRTLFFPNCSVLRHSFDGRFLWKLFQTFQSISFSNNFRISNLSQAASEKSTTNPMKWMKHCVLSAVDGPNLSLSPNGLTFKLEFATVRCFNSISEVSITKVANIQNQYTIRTSSKTMSSSRITLC